MSTIRTLAAGLSELLRLNAHSGEKDGAASLFQLLDCPQQPVHREAIALTIEILKETKGTFKSKRLGDLRARLESLLEN